MGYKALRLIAAACAACLAAPCFGQELRAPMTTFFMEIPLGPSARDLTPNFGLSLQGTQSHRSVRIDRRTFERFKFLPAIAGIEATWIVAGAVGVAAVATIASKDKATSQQLDQQKQQQAEDCPPCVPQ